MQFPEALCPYSNRGARCAALIEVEDLPINDRWIKEQAEAGGATYRQGGNVWPFFVVCTKVGDSSTQRNFRAAQLPALVEELNRQRLDEAVA